MKTLLISIVSFLALIPGICNASTQCSFLTYQPIYMRNEGNVISLPDSDFIILPVPMQSGFSIPEKPYGAIASPYVMMSERKKQGDTDLNVISTAGITIDSNCTYEGDKVKEEVVTLDFSKFKATYNDLSLEVIAEATLECIRLTATDEHQRWLRPVIKIIGKPADEAMWKRWVETFNKQDFSKPFKRPQAIEK